MIINDLVKKEILRPGANLPKWLPHNTHYLTVMGSEAYGVSSDSSDKDVYGFVMPPLDIIFPHLGGHIPGFGPSPRSFEQWQMHHIKDSDGKKEWDFSIYSIVKYFSLCAENNPNMIDSLFTGRTSIIHATGIGNKVRDNRTKFLHLGAYNKFRGYAYAQMHKIRTKTSPENEKRKADVEKYGYDTKFAYHVVRLVNECHQILLTGDLDLQKDNEILKAIRRGEWTLDRLEQWFENSERTLEASKDRSKLPSKPDMDFLKTLLLECIEDHYGRVSHLISVTGKEHSLLSDLKLLVSRYE